MLIGIDFDNTIVCYDEAFHEAALEQGLIPEGLTKTKLAVRDFLRRQGREDEWTALQGSAYGPQIGKARPFPGARDFFAALGRHGVPVRIVSHKTRRPYLGPPHDLHRAAAGWLALNGFFEPDGCALTPGDVFFELTKQDKVRRIRELGCSHFIDDLPEFLEELAGIPGLIRVLFDPGACHEAAPGMLKASSFAELARLVLAPGSRAL